jgi:hypothetical protein
MTSRWQRRGAVWILSPPDPPGRTPAQAKVPQNLEFEIFYDDDQGKLAGLPFYGFAARR